MTCKVQCCMFSSNIYLKNKLVLVNQIDIHKTFIQTIIHNTFKCLRKNRKNRNRAVVLSILFFTFFTFCNLALFFVNLCSVFIAFGRILDFLSCFPVIIFSTYHVCVLFRRETFFLFIHLLYLRLE